jgi:hypothetical protein
MTETMACAQVSHIMGRNKIAPAKLTPGVRLPGGTLVYPAARTKIKA